MLLIQTHKGELHKMSTLLGHRGSFITFETIDMIETMYSGLGDIKCQFRNKATKKNSISLVIMLYSFRWPLHIRQPPFHPFLPYSELQGFHLFEFTTSRNNLTSWPPWQPVTGPLIGHWYCSPPP